MSHRRLTNGLRLAGIYLFLALGVAVSIFPFYWIVTTRDFLPSLASMPCHS